MRRTIALAAALLGGALLAVPAVPAAAVAAQAGPAAPAGSPSAGTDAGAAPAGSPSAWADAGAPLGRGLVLTIAPGDGSATRSVVLRCRPAPHGSHPRAAEACAALAAVHGNLDALPGDGRLCPQIWDPVTLRADGGFDGRPVRWSHTFPNACAAVAATTPVFDF